MERQKLTNLVCLVECGKGDDLITAPVLLQLIRAIKDPKKRAQIERIIYED